MREAGSGTAVLSKTTEMLWEDSAGASSFIDFNQHIAEVAGSLHIPGHKHLGAGSVFFSIFHSADASGHINVERLRAFSL